MKKKYLKLKQISNIFLPQCSVKMKKKKKLFSTSRNTRTTVPYTLKIKKTAQCFFYINNTNYLKKHDIYFYNYFLAGVWGHCLRQGKKAYIDRIYKNLIVSQHQQRWIDIRLCFFKLMSLLQFNLQLKGYRYKVGRGVIKKKYILAPVLLYRQLKLSFFYFAQGLKKHNISLFFLRFIKEYQELLLYEQGASKTLVGSLYYLANQFRMFTVKARRRIKRNPRKKKITYVILVLFFFFVYRHLQQRKYTRQYIIFFILRLRSILIQRKYLILKQKRFQ